MAEFVCSSEMWWISHFSTCTVTALLKGKFLRPDLNPDP